MTEELYSLKISFEEVKMLSHLIDVSIQTCGYTLEECNALNDLVYTAVEDPTSTVTMNKEQCRKLLHIIDHGASASGYDQGEIADLYLHVDEAWHFFERNLAD